MTIKTKERLAQKKCQPYEDNESPLSRDDFWAYLREIPDWHVTGNDKGLFREFQMKNFSSAIDFIKDVAEVAEAEGHHPDIHLTNYRKLRVDFTTHAVGGLSDNDFIMAAKIDELPYEPKEGI